MTEISEARPTGAERAPKCADPWATVRGRNSKNGVTDGATHGGDQEWFLLARLRRGSARRVVMLLEYNIYV